jgi:magnesium chelatase subunit D
MTRAPGLREADAALAAAIFAVDPRGTGVRLRGGAGAPRQRWLDSVRTMLPSATPFVRVPSHASAGRLLGELDLTATLSAGRPIAARGLLADAHGGVLCLTLAERIERFSAASIAAAMDRGSVSFARDGLTATQPAQFGVIALDESFEEEEPPPLTLLDRLALWLDMNGGGEVSVLNELFSAEDIARAADRLGSVSIGEHVIEALCKAGDALAVTSLRPIWLAVRVARIAAALDGRSDVTEADAVVAGRLVLAPRACVTPSFDTPSGETNAQSQPADEGAADFDRLPEGALEDRVIAAAHAAIPADVIARLKEPASARNRTSLVGRAGALAQALRRGRPAGVRSALPRAGARLNIIETLRAAAPWQRLRQSDGARGTGSPRIVVRPADFRVQRLKHRTATTSIFVVDASGSSALHRLAEAKGAVELLLAECYVRRDQVALIAFRGRRAELLLPPTRSLSRARRGLAGLPGGGGTPLACGIELGLDVADQVKRRGQQPILLTLLDGRANIGRDGMPGREHAEADALALAKQVRAEGVAAVVIDISVRPQPFTQRLAVDMGARYLALPDAAAASISSIARAAAESRGFP